jgi:hypothetical protein
MMRSDDVVSGAETCSTHKQNGLIELTITWYIHQPRQQKPDIICPDTQFPEPTSS